MRTAQAPCVSSCSQRKAGLGAGTGRAPQGATDASPPPERAPPPSPPLPGRSLHPELLLLLRAARPQETRGGSPHLSRSSSRPGPLPPCSVQPPTSHPPQPLSVWVTDAATYVFHRVSVLLLVEEFVERSHVGLLKTGLRKKRSLKRSLRSLGPNLKDLELGRDKLSSGPQEAGLSPQQRGAQAPPAAEACRTPQEGLHSSCA